MHNYQQINNIHFTLAKKLSGAKRQGLQARRYLSDVGFRCAASDDRLPRGHFYGAKRQDLQVRTPTSAGEPLSRGEGIGVRVS